LLSLSITKRTDERLLDRMRNHYSKPAGFVGRSICYEITYAGDYYGHIIAGSATRFLPGRNEYLGVELGQINQVINNIFFNVSPLGGAYPTRNFTTLVVSNFVERAAQDWETKYGDFVVGFETLVEKPRTGELYKRAGWEVVGETKGFTCKRVAGVGTDNWTGKRVWNTAPESLRPKLVLCHKFR